MPKSILLGIFLCLLQAASGQRLYLKGKVVDSASGKGLPSATVSLAAVADTSLLTFGLADSAGDFRIVTGGGGPYLLSLSFAGYEPVWLTLSGLPKAGEYELGRISLVPYGLLPLARVRGRRPPVEINNDTIEFNAENFKTQPNAVVEDMLRKIPGVTVESDGTVKVNGQTVRRVLVNGKEFFTGDVKMATKNLNADAVDKLQVFDRKSDQAQFTGVDDGNSEKTINIRLKKDRNFATFGKAAAGGGSNTRYDAQGNLNRFRGDEQLSFLAMANNTNRQGFSLMDALNFSGALARGMRNGGSGISIRTGDAGDNNGLPVTGLGQNLQGIARTVAGGVNINNTWDKGRTSLNGHFTTSDIRLVTDRQSLIQNLGDSVYNTFDTTRSMTRVSQQRLGMTLDRMFDSSFSLRLTPTLIWQQTHATLSEGYNSMTGSGSLLNAGNNRTGSAPGAFNLASDLLLRKRLARKGRTISLDLNVTYNHSSDKGNQVSDNTFSVIDQRYSRDAITRSAGGNLTYTEPVGRRSLIAVSGYYNVNTGNTDKSASDFNAASGKYDLPDSMLSNHFGSDYRYGGGGISFRSNINKLSLTAGGTVQAASLVALNLSGGSELRQHFTDLLPNALLELKLSQTRNIRLEYTTYTTQPSPAQLQPVPDLSNPLDVSTGNPALKRTYNRNLTFTYLLAQFQRRRNLMMMLTATGESNAIVQSDSITAMGTRYTMPVNANGVGNLLGNLAYGFPFAHGRLDAEATVVYSANVNYINRIRNNISSTSIRPSLSYTWNKGDKLDLGLSAAISLISGRYSLQPSLNTSYLRQHYGLNMTNYLPAGLSVHNELDYIFNTGRPPGYNTNTPLWNLSVARTLFRRDRGEIKLAVMDMLGQNTGLTRNIGQGSIQDERYNVLQRYFLLSFTYSLNKSGLRTKGGPQIRVRTLNSD